MQSSASTTIYLKVAYCVERNLFPFCKFYLPRTICRLYSVCDVMVTEEERLHLHQSSPTPSVGDDCLTAVGNTAATLLASAAMSTLILGDKMLVL